MLILSSSKPLHEAQFKCAHVFVPDHQELEQYECKHCGDN